ncbi:MAG: hypothetical protein HY984_01800 [Candidatus Magasanikbacteria bacterium]|nr:hypothetical protein [Candidatus Magasanikbacteria bacterium]
MSGVPDVSGHNKHPPTWSGREGVMELLLMLGGLVACLIGWQVFKLVFGVAWWGFKWGVKLVIGGIFAVVIIAILLQSLH